MKYIRYLYYSIIVIYAPCILAVPLIMRGAAGGDILPLSYGFELFIILLYTLPFYFAFIEIGMMNRRISDNKDVPKHEKLLNITGDAAAVGIIVTAIDIHKLLYIAVALAAVLAVKWCIGAIVFRQRLIDTEFVKRRSFWVIAAALFAAVIAVIAVCKFSLNSRNVPDDTICVGMFETVR